MKHLATGPVVVGIDGSAASLAAVDLAAEEAAARVTPLLVVHAHTGEAVRPEAIRDMLDVAVRRAHAEHPGLSVAAEVASGAPADVLLSRALQACLLVVGHRGPLHRHALGSVAMTVIDQARVPVIVARPTDVPAGVSLPRPVLVGVVAAEESAPVLEFAFAEAELRGAPLHAMYVWSHSGDWEPAEVHADVEGFAEAQSEAERMLAEALAGWSAKYPDVTVSRTVRHSLDAIIALTAASRSAQLVVVGTTHAPAIARLLAGSVGHALVHRAGCPVAVIDASPMIMGDHPLGA